MVPTTALVTTLSSRFEPIPDLKAPEQSTTTVVATVPPAPQRGLFGSWFASKPAAPVDPVQNDANRAWRQAAGLPNQVAALSGMLGNNTQLLTTAPNNWEELLTPYVLARAATVAVMASMKVQLDEALDAGVQTALALPSRDIYQRSAAKVRAADAECEALIPTARARHAEAMEAQAKVTQAAEQAKTAERNLRESVRDLDPKVRTGLIEHIRALAEGGYHFARAAYQDPAAPPNVDINLIPPEGVIPTLVLHGTMVFGKKHPASNYNVIPHGNQRPVNSLAELIELAESLMGRIPRE